MHNKDKYPEIFAAMEAAIGELEVLKAKRYVHTDAMKPLRTEQGKLQEKLNSLNSKAMVDYDRIVELRMSISRFAKAMGAKGLTAEPIGG